MSDVGDQNRYVEPVHISILSELSFFSYRTLLHIGCGRGELLALIPPRKGIMLAGIDRDLEDLRAARDKLGSRAEIRHGEFPLLPWEAGAFDIVLCSGNYHADCHPEQMLKEVFRLLTPGGRMIATVPWQTRPGRFFSSLLRRKNSMRTFSEEEYTLMLQNTGFELVRWRQLDRQTCLAVARRQP